MSEPTQNPSELARETLKTLAARKLPPTPDSYARIYAEISGVGSDEISAAGKVLRDIADHLSHTPQSASVGIALKKMVGAQDWEQYLKEIEKVLPKPKENGPSLPSWSDLIRDLLRQLETTHKGLTVSRKKEGLETVLSRFAAHPETLFEKLTGLMRSWSESPLAQTLENISPPAASGATALSSPAHGDTEMLATLSELLAQTLESILGTQPELAQEVQTLTRQVRNINSNEQVTTLAKQLRPFWIKVELRGGDKAKIHEGLLRLLRLLVENIGEMVEDEEWLHGQIALLQAVVANPVDIRAIADAERSLRDAIIKQGILKHSLTDAKTTLKSLMTTFIDRLGEITESTGDYHHKIEGYSQKISQKINNSDNLSELSHLLDDIMQDTRITQIKALRSHEELAGLRKQAQESESKIQQLQQELAQISEQVYQDQLTGALNRRGLDEAFEREATRADRSQTPICVALLDIDNFKRINDTLGHRAGDQALVHLSRVIKEALRPSDAVGRYGGEEFIIVLPDTAIEQATETIERLQRELTKKFFLDDNERILITFSAGVALRTPQESQQDVVGRADKAMYQAKKAGKNRVVVAE